MLDPLTALSVASNVVQLVDFGLGLFRDADEIHSRGSSVEVRNLQVLNSDLIGLNQTLKDKRKAGITSGDALTREEQVRVSLTPTSLTHFALRYPGERYCL
jgi:hypothetical protein